MKAMKVLMVGAVLAGSLSVTGAAFAKVDHTSDSYNGHTRHEAANTAVTPASEAKPVETVTEEVKPVVQSAIPDTSTYYGATAGNKK